MLNNPAHTYHNISFGTPLFRRLHLDGFLLGVILLIALGGLFVLFSASGGNQDLVTKHAIRLVVAAFAMLVVAQIHPLWLARWAPLFFLITVAILGWVLISGVLGKGAQRWIDIGIMRFQPSELAKITVPMFCAWLIYRKPLPIKFSTTIMVLIAIGLAVGLIILQPDLGTSILVTWSGVVCLFLAGIRWRFIFSAGAIGMAAAPLLWMSMHGYQKARVLTFLDPERDPLGAGYHTIQSKIALGSGGLLGKGWLEGSQAQFDFLPESSTDFVFAVLGEEFGLIGALIAMALYAAVVVRGFIIAAEAQNTFARLFAASLSATFFIYFFVNMGMVAGILPVVGVPLPLVSYGGSSMLTTMIAIGLLMSIHTHRKLLVAK